MGNQSKRFVVLLMFAICIPRISLGQSARGATAFSENVKIVVKDPQGRRTGIELYQWYYEGGFFDQQRGALEDGGPDDPLRMIVALEGIDGWYEVKVSGERLCEYRIEVDVRYPDSTEDQHYEATGMIDRDLTEVYRFRSSTHFSPADTLAKIVGLGSLRQNVTLIDRLQYVASSVVRESLLVNINRAEAALDAGNMALAQTMLDSLLSRVDLFDGKIMLTEAAGLLRRDCLRLKSTLSSPSVQLLVPSLYKRVQLAIDAAPRGSEVRVSPGFYDEIVRFAGKDSIRLMGTGSAGSVRLRGVQFAGCSTIAIENVVLDGQGTGRSGVELGSGPDASTDVIIERCEVKGAGKGLSGIYVGTGNARVRIANGSIHSNGGHGIHFEGGSGCNYILNNTVVRNSGSGIVIGAVDTLYAVNNIFSFNGTRTEGSMPRCGVTTAGQHDPNTIILLNNLVVGNPTDIGNAASVLDPQAQEALDSGNLTTNGSEGIGVAASPSSSFASIFLSGGRQYLLLTEGSVAVDRGLSWYSRPDVGLGAIPALDREGTPRGGTRRIDCGCYEVPKE